MVIPSNFFHIERISTSLYALRERLDLIDHTFLTEYVNAYLYITNDSAVLIDTGNGIIDYKTTLSKLIDNRELLVFNTHNHFDHVAGNRFFENVHLHKLDAKSIIAGIDVRFLQYDDAWYHQIYQQFNYILPTASTTTIVQGGETFDLGDSQLIVHYTPGHSSGCISIQIDNFLFTGDTFHKGAVYLPEYADMGTYIASLYDLLNLSVTSYCTGHETLQLSPTDLTEFIKQVEAIHDDYFTQRPYNEKLSAYIASTPSYTFVIPTNE